MASDHGIEKAIGDYVEELYGEAWPTIAFVVYARVTDPESMEFDSSVWITPPGQRSFVTRGLLEEARSEYEAENLPIFTFTEAFDDDEEP